MPRKSATSNNIATIAINLPADLVQRAREKLEMEREIELETFIAIYLRMMLRVKNILRLNDTFPFGKYNGEIVEHVVRIDPNYVAWLISQDGRTKFDPEVLTLTNEMLQLS